MLLSPSTSVAASRRRCAFSRRRTLRASALLRVREDARELVSWKQTPTELLVRVRLGGPLSGVPRAGVACKITPKRLRLSVGAGEPVLDGAFETSVNDQGSFWQIEEEAGGRVLVINLEKQLGALHECLLDSDAVSVGDAAVTREVFLDISVDGQQPDRITLGLFGDAAPRTAANFAALCTGEAGPGPSGKPRHFKGVSFHRIIPGFMIQSGDTTAGDGTGGESIYGERFDDEPFVVKHSSPFLLSMANAGPNTNGSQFFITTAAAPHLNGKHVVFGRVLAGAEVVKMIEACGSPDGKPESDVRIVDCGVLK